MIIPYVQLESLKIPFVLPEELPSKLKDQFDLVIDAMFGFSFHGKRCVDYSYCLLALALVVKGVAHSCYLDESMGSTAADKPLMSAVVRFCLVSQFVAT